MRVFPIHPIPEAMVYDVETAPLPKLPAIVQWFYKKVLPKFPMKLRQFFWGLIYRKGRLYGNRPLKLVMPVDPNAPVETRLYLGNVTNHQSQVQETWTKQEVTPITFKFSGSEHDNLINSNSLVCRRIGRGDGEDSGGDQDLPEGIIS